MKWKRDGVGVVPVQDGADRESDAGVLVEIKDTVDCQRAEFSCCNRANRNTDQIPLDNHIPRRQSADRGVIDVMPFLNECCLWHGELNLN